MTDALERIGRIKRLALDAHPGGVNKALSQIVRTCIDLEKQLATPAPQTNMPCPCTTFEQSEECPVGHSSLLCSACGGTGEAPLEKVVALAAEMMKVAEQVDELEDPFAAWESIDLLKSHNDQYRKALRKIAMRADDSLPLYTPGSMVVTAEAALAATATEGSDRG
jgi:hypothetical protein